MRVLISLLFSFLLIGCGAGGPVYTIKPPETGKARLVIYRTAAAGSAIDMSHVLVDKKMVGGLWRGSYIEIDVKPGKHNAIVYFHNQSKPPINFPLPVRIDVTLKPNETKYIKYDVYVAHQYNMYVFKMVSDLAAVKKEIAIQELTQKKYQESEYFDKKVKLPHNKQLDDYISKL